MALRLLALLDGIRSAREVSRLTATHMAYRWTCVDEPVDHHSLADSEALEALMARSAAALIHAGAGSFRRELSLRDHLAEVEARIERLKAEANGDDDRDDEDPGRSPRRLAARERAAREQKRRIDAALAALDELRRANERRSPSKRTPSSELRASMTNPEATEMKMADGGYRPAYDVQFAATVEGNVIVGVAVTAEGVDSAQVEPMLARVESGSTRLLAPVSRVEEWRRKGSPLRPPRRVQRRGRGLACADGDRRGPCRIPPTCGDRRAGQRPGPQPRPDAGHGPWPARGALG